MASKIRPPKYSNVAIAFNESYCLMGYPTKKAFQPAAWQKFLETCGLQHISFTRLIVVDKEKYLIAKIKYGF